MPLGGKYYTLNLEIVNFNKNLNFFFYILSSRIRDRNSRFFYNSAHWFMNNFYKIEEARKKRVSLFLFLRQINEE